MVVDSKLALTLILPSTQYSGIHLTYSMPNSHFRELWRLHPNQMKSLAQCLADSRDTENVPLSLEGRVSASVSVVGWTDLGGGGHEGSLADSQEKDSWPLEMIGH